MDAAGRAFVEGQNNRLNQVVNLHPLLQLAALITSDKTVFLDFCSTSPICPPSPQINGGLKMMVSVFPMDPVIISLAIPSGYGVP